MPSKHLASMWFCNVLHQWTCCSMSGSFNKQGSLENYVSFDVNDCLEFNTIEDSLRFMPIQ